MGRRSIGLAVCLAVLAAIVASAATQDPRTKRPAAGSRLLALDAKSGTLTPVAHHPGRFRLILRGVHAAGLWFDDRPGTLQGSEPIAPMLRALFGPGQADPNAAINAEVANKGQELMGVTLHTPRYDARRHTLTFLVDRLRRSGAGGAGSRTDVVLPPSLGRTALLIDNWGGQTTPVQFFNTSPAQLNLSINNGPLFAISGASNSTAWQAGTANGGSMSPSPWPQPGMLSIGQNFITVQPTYSGVTSYLHLALPQAVQYDNLQVYIFESPYGAASLLALNDGSLVARMTAMPTAPAPR